MGWWTSASICSDWRAERRTTTSPDRRRSIGSSAYDARSSNAPVVARGAGQVERVGHGRPAALPTHESCTGAATPYSMPTMSSKDDDAPGGGPRSLPLLPLRDIIVFPHMVVPLFVGREKSISALEEAMASDKELLLAAQKKAKTNDPKDADIF